MFRIGKKLANKVGLGRLLDGQFHNDMPLLDIRARVPAGAALF